MRCGRSWQESFCGDFFGEHCGSEAQRPQEALAEKPWPVSIVLLLCWSQALAEEATCRSGSKGALPGLPLHGR